MIRVREASGALPIGVVRARGTSGLQAIATIRVRETDGLKTVYTDAGPGTFNVSAIPLAPNGAVASSFTSNVTTEVVTVTATGGVEPYTFAFRQTDSATGWSISVVGNGQARFTRSSVGQGQTWQADFKCEVTDAAGRKIDTPTIQATVTNYGGISMV
ncbi:hypothetical protein [Novosphingobium sp. M1R2S20]|uniref:Uncharacterized protein n=1 Tax=Novosphingobium rhizovicinum TaxID=3228928 RepID=A0ABV3RCU4_9SPHN